MDQKDLCEHTRIRLIAAALGHQQCTATDGTAVLIPGTNKRILVGDDAYLARVAGRAKPNCGACPGDSSICKTECRHRAENPPAATDKKADTLDPDQLRADFEKRYGPRDSFAWLTNEGKYKIPSLQSAWEIYHAATEDALARCSPPHSGAGLDERAMFEAWAVSDDGGWMESALKRNPEGHEFDYADDDVEAEWRAWKARAALAQQAGAPTDPNQRLHDYEAGVLQGVAEEQARAFQEQVRALLAAPAPAAAQEKGTPESIAASNARFAIDGAIQYGRENRHAPPSADHWLYEYWNIGRQLAKLGETGWDNVTPMASECGKCNDAGIIGFPPDQYESCPDCTPLAAPAPAIAHQAAPAAVTQIPLQGMGGAELVRDEAYGGWVLMRDAAQIRHLDQFERSFINSAIAATTAADASPTDEARDAGELVQLRAQNMLLARLYDAAAKLVKAKGRFHTEQNYAQLVAAYDLVRTADSKGNSSGASLATTQAQEKGGAQ
ncbi:hypothetical protein AB595_21755 [Massilia sp. WF1]|uniref:hypothetical protein n=1 Tax=unclassified Massilia TaxID=2609279 RepID=UPI00064B3C53|nr:MULTISPECIES: hypothetical protein [unclassified Massilia]ALK97009.1 hypothetical protein AM586_12835 [Massilia sp. WG5]KLU34723.1 hypothetical protein AB595_21755 [Massilia sp. WF1]